MRTYINNEGKVLSLPYEPYKGFKLWLTDIKECFKAFYKQWLYRKILRLENKKILLKELQKIARISEANIEFLYYAESEITNLMFEADKLRAKIR